MMSARGVGWGSVAHVSHFPFLTGEGGRLCTILWGSGVETGKLPHKPNCEQVTPFQSCFHMLPLDRVGGQ